METGSQENILRVALDLFTARGYAGTSVGDVAAQLGVSKAALYYHFRDKEEILVKLVSPHLDRVEALLDREPKALRGELARRRMLGEYLDLLIEDRPIIRLLAQDITSRGQGDIDHRVKSAQAALCRLLSGSQPTRAAEVRAASALGALSRPLVMLPKTDVRSHKEMLVKAALAVLSIRPK